MSEKKGSSFNLKEWYLMHFDTKVKRAWSLIIACAAVLVLVSIAVSGIVSLFEDGKVIAKIDFESYNASDFEQNSYTGGASYFTVPAAGEGIDGSMCLRLTNLIENDARLTKKIKLTGGKYYRIQADVKVSDIEGEKGANVSILESKDSGFTFVNGGGSWVHIDQYVTAAKTDTYTLCMRLGYYSAEAKGTAWFDNISVTQVSSVPAGKSVVKINTNAAATVTSDAKYNESLYQDMRFVSWMIVGFSFLAFLIYGLYVRAYDKLGYEYIPGTKKIKFLPRRYAPSDRTPFKTVGRPLAVLITVFVLALVARLVLTVTYFECTIDVGLFKYWGRVAAENGIGQLYKVATNCDYPPLYAYFLACVTSFGKFLGLGDKGMTLMIKLPSILADLGIGIAVYYAAIKKRYSFGSAVFFASAWLFNPISFLDSACWGQVDSMLALLVLLCCIALNGKRYFGAGLFFGLGVMLKPQMIIFLPVAGCVFISDFIMEIVKGKTSRSFGFLGKVFLGGLLGLAGPCIPFFGMGMADVSILGKTMRLPWIFQLFFGTIDHYPYATVNNYNFWFLLGKNWVKDDTKMGPLTIHSYAMIAIVLISLVVVGVYVYKTAMGIIAAKRRKDDPDAVPSKTFHPGLVFLAGAAMFAMVSCFGPRMHERYFFPAVVLLLVAAICYHRKGLLGAYGLISGIGFVTVHEIMLGLLVGASIKEVKNNSSIYGDYYWPKLNDYRGVLACITTFTAVLIMGLFIANSLLEKKEFAEELSETEAPRRKRVKVKKTEEDRYFEESYLTDDDDSSISEIRFNADN